MEGGAEGEADVDADALGDGVAFSVGEEVSTAAGSDSVDSTEGESEELGSKVAARVSRVGSGDAVTSVGVESADEVIDASGDGLESTESVGDVVGDAVAEG